MKRKPFVAVIGEARSGKTTVVRSLTGCPAGWPRGGQFVIDKTDGREIYVIDKSPQESGLNKNEFEKALRQCIRKKSLVGIVMALQPTEPRTRLSIEDVFAAVSGHRQLLPIAVVLNPGYNSLSNGRSASDVRKRLSPFGAKVVALNGQRFAHLNARRIRKLAGIP